MTRVIIIARSARARLRHGHRNRLLCAVRTFHRHLQLGIVRDRATLALLVVRQCEPIEFGARFAGSLALGEPADGFNVLALAVLLLNGLNQSDGLRFTERNG